MSSLFLFLNISYPSGLLLCHLHGLMKINFKPNCVQRTIFLFSFFWFWKQSYRKLGRNSSTCFHGKNCSRNRYGSKFLKNKIKFNCARTNNQTRLPLPPTNPPAKYLTRASRKSEYKTQIFTRAVTRDFEIMSWYYATWRIIIKNIYVIRWVVSFFFLLSHDELKSIQTLGTEKIERRRKFFYELWWWWVFFPFLFSGECGNRAHSLGWTRACVHLDDVAVLYTSDFDVPSLRLTTRHRQTLSNCHCYASILTVSPPAPAPCFPFFLIIIIFVGYFIWEELSCAD